MTPTSRWIYATCFAFAGAGFLLPFWPLSVVGIIIAALSGRYIFAVIVGLLLDLAWGTPGGVLHYLYVPFTLLALLGILARAWGGRYFLDRSAEDKI